jgi:hypothetical protein
MDSKLTLSFDKDTITKAKKFADSNHISLSRLIEFMLNKATTAKYKSLDDLPVSEWINMLSEGEVEYRRTPRSRKTLKKEYFESKKPK